jgi:hypothetical protein
MLGAGKMFIESPVANKALGKMGYAMQKVMDFANLM